MCCEQNGFHFGIGLCTIKVVIKRASAFPFRCFISRGTYFAFYRPVRQNQRTNCMNVLNYNPPKFRQFIRLEIEGIWPETDSAIDASLCADDNKNRIRKYSVGHFYIKFLYGPPYKGVLCYAAVRPTVSSFFTALRHKLGHSVSLCRPFICVCQLNSTFIRQ